MASSPASRVTQLSWWCNQLYGNKPSMVRLTKPNLTFLYCHFFFSLFDFINWKPQPMFTYWISRLLLICFAAAKPWRNISNMNVIQRITKSFDKVTNMPDGKWKEASVTHTLDIHDTQHPVKVAPLVYMIIPPSVTVQVIPVTRGGSGLLNTVKPLI